MDSNETVSPGLAVFNSAVSLAFGTRLKICVNGGGVQGRLWEAREGAAGRGVSLPLALLQAVPEASGPT